MKLLNSALKRENSLRPPVWFMRQAGRYHLHYQKLREKHSFTELCKTPTLSCEVALGPVAEFDFDAAILFSDLLFPLECLGMDLNYDESGPKLGGLLKSLTDVSRLKGKETVTQMEFQAESLRLLKGKLPKEKGIIGFIGSPLTLFFYAVEGKHQGILSSARAGLVDGRFLLFCEKISDFLIENMALQASAGVDAIAIFDSCVGEIDYELYSVAVVPVLSNIVQEFKRRYPHISLIYYGKGAGPRNWEYLKNLAIDGLGIDWTQDMIQTLKLFADRWAIQGNVDPHWLTLSTQGFEAKLRDYFQKIAELPKNVRRGWICGLGHGIKPQTPESHVKLFLNIQREIF